MLLRIDAAATQILSIMPNDLSVKVPSPPQETYQHWLDQQTPVFELRDHRGPTPPERVMQAIWHHQRINPRHLGTSRGQPLRVLHPGFWNHGAGPDFRKAVIQIGSRSPTSGDIEIDQSPQDWYHHHHHANPAFQHVILQVAWAPATPPRHALPVLYLQTCLDSPLSKLVRWANQAEQDLSPLYHGQCSHPLESLADPEVRKLLRQAAGVRFRHKAQQIEARARLLGWDQSLWEHLIGALGYKRNYWPMRYLGQQTQAILKNLDPVHPESSYPLVYARMLGTAGLLDPQSAGRETEATEFWRSLWDFWWRERDAWAELCLPHSAWDLNGLRPSNHPARRIAIAASWAIQGHLSQRLADWFKSCPPGRQALVSLEQALQVEVAPAFWRWHWSLHSARTPKPTALLGSNRITDLAINVLLPCFWSRAIAGKNHGLAKKALALYLSWPKAQSNAVLTLACQRLIPARGARFLHHAAEQQGLLQIVRDFCENSDALCEGCRFPRLVESLHEAPTALQ